MPNSYSFNVLTAQGYQTRYYSYNCRESAYFDYMDLYLSHNLTMIKISTPGQWYNEETLNNLCNFLETNILKSNKVSVFNSNTICIENKGSHDMSPEPPSIALIMFLMRYMTKYFVTECTFDFIISELMTKRWYRFIGIPKSRFKTALYMYLCYISNVTLTEDNSALRDSNGPASYLDSTGVAETILDDFILRYPKECKATLKSIRRTGTYPYCFIHDRILKYIHGVLFPKINLVDVAEQLKVQYW